MPFTKVRQDVYLPRFSSPLSISYTEKKTEKFEKRVSIIWRLKNRVVDRFSLYTDPVPDPGFRSGSGSPV
jgi:hypothetical protein